MSNDDILCYSIVKVQELSELVEAKDSKIAMLKSHISELQENLDAYIEGIAALRDQITRLQADSDKLKDLLREMLDKACTTRGEWMPIDVILRVQKAIR